MASETDIQALDNIARAIREAMLAFIRFADGHPLAAKTFLVEKIKENE